MRKIVPERVSSKEEYASYYFIFYQLNKNTLYALIGP